MTGAPVCQLNQMGALRALHHASPQAGGDAAAVAFEAELVLQGPDDRLHPLPQPVREEPGGLLVLMGRADQRQAQVRAGEERFGVLAGQALIGDDGRARGGAASPACPPIPPIPGTSPRRRVGQKQKVPQAACACGALPGLMCLTPWWPATPPHFGAFDQAPHVPAGLAAVRTRPRPLAPRLPASSLRPAMYQRPSNDLHPEERSMTAKGRRSKTLFDPREFLARSGQARVWPSAVPRGLGL